MRQSFGDTLRKLRRTAGVTLGGLAKELDMSIVYLSDVERGNRKPFTNERILRIAAVLKIDPEPLIEAADRDRGFIEYNFRTAPPLEADVVGGLVAGLARGGITDDQLRKIREILQERDGADD